jgi:hypothetical protein
MKLKGVVTAAQTNAHGSKVRQAWSVKHIGTGFFVGLQTTDRVVQMRIGVQEIVRSRRQNEAERESARCLRRGGNPFDSEADIVKGTIWIAS